MKADDILDALERHHAATGVGIVQWCFAREVPLATGGAQRRMDAVAINCWRSKSYTVRGYEVKVSRADFRKELSQPHKSEGLRRLCDEFVFAVPRGLVTAKELEEAGEPFNRAGLIQVNALGDIRTLRAASRMVPVGLDSSCEIWPPEFIASVVRSGQRTALLQANKARREAERWQRIAEVKEREYKRALSELEAVNV